MRVPDGATACEGLNATFRSYDALAKAEQMDVGSTQAERTISALPYWVRVVPIAAKNS
jgi:hypothetical protein